MEQRECPVCRRTFDGRNNQRFCPPPKDWTGKGQPRSKCAKAYDNAKRRGTLDALLARGGVGAPFDCAECGKRCTPGQDGVAAHASRFCGHDCKSIKCKREWHEKHTPRPRPRQIAARQKAKRALKLGPPRRWIEGRCRDCDERFAGCFAGSWQAHYCSETCRNRQSRARRRARKQKAFVEEVWRPILFKRDGWTCQLCGDPVDPSLKYPDLMAATVDHIVPLSRGGEHSYANTQLAHALCNSLKGDHETGSMLFAA